MCTQIFSEGTPFYPFYPLEKSLVREGTGHQICRVELRFLTCAHGYNQEKMCPFYLYKYTL